MALLVRVSGWGRVGLLGSELDEMFSRLDLFEQDKRRVLPGRVLPVEITAAGSEYCWKWSGLYWLVVEEEGGANAAKIRVSLLLFLLPNSRHQNM